MNAATARVARNAASGGGRFAASAVIALLVTPYALATLGAQRYGIWALGGAVLTTVKLLDLGLGRSVVRAVATDKSDGPVGAEAREAVAAGLGAQLLLGAAAVIVLALLRDSLLTVLHIPPPLRREAGIVLVGTGAVAVIEALSAQYQAGLDGIGRMDLGNAVDGVQRIASGIGTVIVLGLGGGLAGLVAKNAVTAVAAGLANRRLLARGAPGIGPVWPAWRPGRVRALLAFGRHVQAVNLSALVIDPVAKGILVRATGLDAVALYDVALQVASQIGGGFLAMAVAVFPEAAASAGDPAGRIALWRRAERYVGLAAAGVFGTTIVLAGPFAAAWLGPRYAAVGPLIAILASGWLVAVVTAPSFLVAQAAGAERIATFAGLVTALVSVIGAALLASHGAPGVAVGRAVGLAVGGGLAWVALVSAWRPPAPAPWGLFRVLVGLAVALPVAWEAAAVLEPAGLAGVVVAGTLGIASYMAVLVVSGEIGSAERRLLAAMMGGSR